MSPGGGNLVQTGSQRERAIHKACDLGMIRSTGRFDLGTNCREGSTSQSNFGGMLVDGEGVHIAILLDEAHGD